MPRPAIGLDFGTTNSAIALVGPDGDPLLAHFRAGGSEDSGGGETPTFRSVLYFHQEEHQE